MSGSAPRLCELEGLGFQALCRDLLANQRTTYCYQFGKNGQSQQGIDLVANREDGLLDVAQCKAVEDLTVKKMQDASKEFFDHWEYWMDKKVKRFILLVGSEVIRLKVVEEIWNQQKEFDAKGLEYELWDAPTIVRKLSPFRGVVALHFEPIWVDKICSPSESTCNFQLAGQLALIENLATSVSASTDKQLIEIKEVWNSGCREEAKRLLASIQSNASVWAAISASVKAEVMRFDAGIRMDEEKPFGEVEQLLNDARQLAPSPEDLRFSALLMWHRKLREEAIKSLEGVADEATVTTRSQMLLALGRNAEATSILAAADIEPKTVQRLRTEGLCHFACKRISEARLALQKAKEFAPNRIDVLVTAAAIEFLSTITPGLTPDYIPAWPEPTPWNFVLQDDDSQSRLRGAADDFQKVLDLKDFKGEERSSLEAWYVAALSNIIGGDAIAQRETIKLLKDNKTNYRLLAWAVSRFPHLNVDEFVQAQLTEIGGGNATCEQVGVTAYYFLQHGKWNKAETLLISKRSLFESANAVPLWTMLTIQAKVNQGEIDEAMKIAEDGLKDLQLRQVRSKLTLANPAVPKSDKVAFLEKSFQETNNPTFLMDLAGFQAAARDWEYIARQTNLFINALPTTEIVTICANALQRTGEYRECLRVLMDHLKIFPSNRLSPDLRLLEADCNYALGMRNEAIEQAFRLADEDPSPKNLFTLCEFYIGIGDYRQLCITANRFLAFEGISSDVFVRLAWHAQREDRELAWKLLQKAITSGIGDDEIIVSTQLGFALGKDEETKPLLARMQQLGIEGKAGIKLATLEEIVAYSIESNRRASELNAIYNAGKSPIHLLAQPLNVTMASLYHQHLDDVADSQFSWGCPPLMIRHGGRLLPALSQTSASTRPRLAIDETTLLLAQHYGYLDRLEESFNPLQISSALIPSLTHMHDRLAVNQDERVRSSTLILQKVEAGNIATMATVDQVTGDWPGKLPKGWISLAASALESDGQIVDILPVTAIDGSPIGLDDLPENVRSIVIPQASVLRSLLEHGPLSLPRHGELFDRLGHGHADESFSTPSQGSRLYFAGGSLEFFAHVDLLSDVAKRFQLTIEKAEVEQLKDEIRNHERRMDLAQWLKKLIDRLRDGIGKGVYQVMPVGARRELNRNPFESNLDMEGFRDLINCESASHLLCDDRWANSHSNAGSMAIMDSVEVLATLTSLNKISALQYFETLSRMRFDGLCYIPISSDEILTHLKNANVGKSGMVETGALRNLRRGFAFTLSNASLLQRNSEIGTPIRDEVVSFLLHHLRACTNALAAIWEEPLVNSDVRKERSDWIISSLYIDQHALRIIAELPGDPKVDLYNLSNGYAGILSNGLQLLSRDLKGGYVEPYLKWAFERLLEQRMRWQPDLLPALGHHMAMILKSSLAANSGDSDDEEIKIKRAIAHILLSHFPAPLREAILLHGDFAVAIGARTVEIVQVGDFRFEKREYIEAIAEAINGRSGQIQLLGSHDQISFHPTDPPGNGVVLLLPGTQTEAIVSTPSMPLLSESAQIRENEVTKLSLRFDVPSEGRKEACAAIASTIDPIARFEAAESLLKNSMELFYENLRHSDEEDLKIAGLLPKSLSSLLSHLRIQADLEDANALQQQISTAALDDLESYPLPDVLDRLFRLPIRLPEPVAYRLAALASIDRHSLIKALLCKDRTPLYNVQLIVLLASFSNENQYLRLARRLIGTLVNDKRIGIYLGVIQWSMNQVQTGTESCEWSGVAQMATAWYHGDRIYSILNARGCNMKAVARSLAFSPAFMQMFFVSRGVVDRDVANPANLDPSVFLATGLHFVTRDSHSFTENLSLRNLVNKALVDRQGEHRFPRFGLIASTEQASNLLGSFFEGDRIAMLTKWLDPETVNAVQQFANGDMPQQVVDNVQNNQSEYWFSLFCAFGKFPPRESLLPLIEDVILRTDFSLMASMPERACPALYVASSFLSFFTNQEVAAHLKKQALALARAINANNPKSTNERSFTYYFLEIALNVVCNRTESSERIKEFGILMGDLARAWPIIGEELRPLIQRLCEVLPSELTPELWRLILRLRTQL